MAEHQTIVMAHKIMQRGEPEDLSPVQGAAAAAAPRGQRGGAK